MTERFLCSQDAGHFTRSGDSFWATCNQLSREQIFRRICVRSEQAWTQQQQLQMQRHRSTWSLAFKIALELVLDEGFMEILTFSLRLRLLSQFEFDDRRPFELLDFWAFLVSDPLSPETCRFHCVQYRTPPRGKFGVKNTP